MAVVLVAKYTVKPGQSATVKEALGRAAERVAADEPGCLLYQANQSVDDENAFLLYEVYSDQAALEAHRETPHFKAIIEGEVVPLLDGRERAIYRPVVG